MKIKEIRNLISEAETWKDNGIHERKWSAFAMASSRNSWKCNVTYNAKSNVNCSISYILFYNLYYNNTVYYKPIQ